MVVRHRRKKNKMRGNRTHGGGDTKNRRGAGGRGGVGKAGSHKHTFSKYWKTFGIKITLKAKPKGIAINLEQLEQATTGKKLAMENGMVVIDGKELGFGKLLGKGTIRDKLLVKNAKVSAKAAEKIAEAGGRVEGEEGAEAEEEMDEEEEEK